MHYFKLIVVHPIYCKYLHVYQCAQNPPADQDVTVIDVFQFQYEHKTSFCTFTAETLILFT